MIRLVIDVHIFNTDEKIITLKELVAHDDRRISHYLFKVPFKLNILNAKLNNEALWLMLLHHYCSPWNAGIVPPILFKPITSSLVKILR